MKRIRPIVQLVVGTLLVVLVVNDFVALLLEYLTNVSDLKLPIEWSKGGWKLKFWMIDHPPAFTLYQILFMGTGMLLIFSTLGQWLPRKVNLGIAAGLILSALFVFLFPETHYIVKETPSPFMIAQLLVGAALILVPLGLLNNQRLQGLGIWMSAGLSGLLLIACVVATPVTLWFAVFPIAGSFFLVFTKSKQ